VIFETQGEGKLLQDEWGTDFWDFILPLGLPGTMIFEFGMGSLRRQFD